MTSDSSVELQGLVSLPNWDGNGAPVRAVSQRQRGAVVIGRRRAERAAHGRSADDRVVHQVASWCLDYPDPGLIERLSTMASALGEQQDSEPARMLRPQRLVNAFTAPLHHLFRPYIVYRSRDQEGASGSRTGRPGRGCVGTTDRDRHR